jgi:UPF0755 protein
MNESAFLIEAKERKGILAIAIFILLPIIGFIIFLWWAMRAPVYLPEAQKIKISRGDGFLEIGNILASHGVVRSATLFRLYVLARGWAGSLQPGEYTFGGELTIPAVAKKILTGPGDIEITIPEGLTMYEIEERLVKAGLVNPGEFVTLAHSPDSFIKKFKFLEDIEAESLEGFLFPDTYRFDPRSGSRAIIEKMLATFQEKVLKELESRFRESPQSISNIIKMAAMIEREASRFEDRRLISGILWKRLENNIPLQVDATVVYAWKRLNPQWRLGSKNRLSLSDLKIDSPYNTYRVNGLPPGPIANPGLDSIRAALEPAENEYWYYLSLNDGTILYSRTFEEHKALKEKFYY